MADTPRQFGIGDAVEWRDVRGQWLPAVVVEDIGHWLLRIQPAGAVMSLRIERNRVRWPAGPTIDVDPTRRVIHLTIPDEYWQAIGYNDPEIDGRERLKANVFLNGVGLHLEAIRAWVDPQDGCVKARMPELEHDVHAGLQDVYAGAYELTTIMEDTYIVYATPHAR